LTEREVDASNR